jgi:hypothetical protein
MAITAGRIIAGYRFDRTADELSLTVGCLNRWAACGQSVRVPSGSPAAQCRKSRRGFHHVRRPPRFFCSVPSPAPVVHSRIGRAPHTTHALPASGFSRRCGVAARGAAAASPAGDRSPGAAGPPQLMAKTLACTRASASASLRRSQAERHCIHRPSIQYFTAESPSDRFPAFSAAKYHAFDV